MKIYGDASRVPCACPWIAMIPLAVGVLLLCRAVLFAYYHLGPFDLDPLNLEMLALAIPGALFCLTGWILEGFAKETS